MYSEKSGHGVISKLALCAFTWFLLFLFTLVFVVLLLFLPFVYVVVGGLVVLIVLIAHLFALTSFARCLFAWISDQVAAFK